MNKAIFLDRDGVINNNSTGYYIYKVEDLTLNDGIIESLQILTGGGFLLIIISNQGGIAKGIYSKHDCELIHEEIKRILSKHNITINEIYYCPHHPDKGNCLCRKPESLLFEKAIARFHIDPEQSWMIGDDERDLIAAERAGLKTIGIQPNEDIRKYLNKITNVSSNRDSPEN
jgi:D-glycero-D-manno-heptose 1,7-bisphosphate phosphatase